MAGGEKGPAKGPKQCPKAGKGIWSRYPWLIWLLPIAGLVSLVWFLIRVIPKPSRATYPCQRFAAPIASGFIVWVLGLAGSTLAYRKARRLVGRSRYVVAGFFAATAVGAIWFALSVTGGSPAEAVFVPSDPPNSPMGAAKGIHPGRVVWIRDANATSWNGTSGSWWDDNNTDQEVVDTMISTSLLALTGKSSDEAAWDALFRHFNETHGSGNVGYQSGEKIAIKINKNQDNNKNAWKVDEGNPSPHVIYSVVKQLIDVVGVPGSAITIYDASRYIGNPIYNKIRGNPDADFQNITFVVKLGLAGNGRVAAQRDTSDDNLVQTEQGTDTGNLPRCVTGAKYLINMALLRAHSLYGVTVCAKNHFGSIYNDGNWSPEPLHGYGGRSKAMNTYNCLVNLNGHKHLGGKTLLYMVDGLYPSRNQSNKNGYVIRYVSFDNDWFSSMLVSQDPVALDSVGLDFLRAEQGTPGSSIVDVTGNPDNYLHEMALANNPPSGWFYDPEGDGSRLASLGVHEHWNNDVDRQYTRNLGTGDGIELVTEAQVWTSEDGPVRNMTADKRYDYIQYAINDADVGDEIVVPAGVYPESVDLKNKDLIIRSEEPNDPVVVAATVIDGDVNGVTFSGGQSASCVLSGFTITGGIDGIYCLGASPTITNCRIVGNEGNGIEARNSSKPTISNCCIVGNGGVGIGLSLGRWITSQATITNCTIVGNAGYGVYSGFPTISNSIIYDNNGVEGAGEIEGSDCTITYSDVQGDWDGEGNIDKDPCFADPENGDYHLKSEAGRWDPNSESWVTDDVTSWCIDAGDPNSDWTAELWPHGECINLGAYGGTREASMSLSDAGNVADLNIDGVVDFRDFGGFGNCWKKEQLLMPEDLNRDGRADFFDVEMFVGEWLWEQ